MGLDSAGGFSMCLIRALELSMNRELDDRGWPRSTIKKPPALGTGGFLVFGHDPPFGPAQDARALHLLCLSSACCRQPILSESARLGIAGGSSEIPGAANFILRISSSGQLTGC